ncbi:glycosyltransferase family 4 protein [Methylobacterium sp. WL122]|nr:glycosyltransferase family 4 protein [Methylobacterium sp. WL122]
MRRYVIYTGGTLNIRAGGPLGYLANLQDGLSKISFDGKSEVVILSKPPEPETPELQGQAPCMLTQKDVRSSIDYHKNTREIKLIGAEEEQLSLLSPKIVHAHYYLDVVKLINAREKLGINYKIIYTCHTPESVSDEMASFFMKGGIPRADLGELRSVLHDFECMCYERADMVLFPCRGAMEPALKTVGTRYAKKLNRKSHFALTGAKSLAGDLTRNIARERLSIDADTFVFGFIGRHNNVKGYDLFREAGQRIIERRNNVIMLSAGGNREEVAQSSDRFRELGWCSDPGAILTAIDCLILPNRATYFDLVLIESLSAGTPVMTTLTGGNAVFAGSSANIIQFFEPSIDGLYAAMESKLAAQQEDNSRLNSAALRYYESHLTSSQFAQRYYDALRKMDSQTRDRRFMLSLLRSAKSIIRTLSGRA